MTTKTRRPATPRNSTELAEFFADPGRYKDVVGSKDALQSFINEYAAVAQDSGMTQELRDQMQQELANMLRENIGETDVWRPNLGAEASDAAVQASAKRAGQMGLYDAAAPGVGLNGVFDSFGEYLRTVWNARSGGDPTDPKLAKLRNFSSDVPSEGGFAVPEEFRSDLLSLSLESSVVRPRATVIPMPTARVNLPAIDDSDHQTSVFGGIVGHWTEEGAQLSETTPKFQRLALDAKKLTIYSEIPSELLTDAPQAMMAVQNRLLPQAISHFEDVGFLSGSGVGEPKGVLSANGAVTVTRDTASEIHFDDVVGMFARMLPSSIPRAVWLASLSAFPQLAKLIIRVQDSMGETVGAASGALWLSNGSAIGGPPMTLLGRPVIFTEKVPALGTTGDLAFIDLSMYLLGDRMAMQLRQSEHFKFDQDVISVRLIERADGRPWVQSPITPANGGDTLSPYVLLGPAS